MWRYISADLTQLAKSGKATYDTVFWTCIRNSRRQIRVYVDAEITDGLYWSDLDAVNQHPGVMAGSPWLQSTHSSLAVLNSLA